jgi:putative membrane protein
MFLVVLLFIFLGILVGIAAGLIPGVHPNLIVLSIPLLMTANMEPFYMLAFIVSLAITNSIIDFIPSILLGAPDSGNELSILPGHRMLLRGQGYEAVKLTIIGGLLSVIICTLLIPLLVVFIPNAYPAIKDYIYILLIFIVVLMIVSESGGKKLVALACFMLSGFTGILSGYLPISQNLVLFPMLSGFFGLSVLLLQIKNKTKIPEQRSGKVFVSQSTISRASFFGSIGGIVSGFLPGVGSSQIATMATVDKNEHSFLATIGAITTANIFISMLSLWLIGKGRSGVAVVIKEIMNIGFSEFLFMIAVAVIAAGAASIAALFLTKYFLKIINRINYSAISTSVIIFIVALAFIFTGWYGLLLLIVCTALGVFANLAKIKRGNMMGVLILPTILFYIGF